MFETSDKPIQYSPFAKLIGLSLTRLDKECSQCTPVWRDTRTLTTR